MTDHDVFRIRVGISSCLLGNEVRYDGGHKRDSFLADTLGRSVLYVPVCPEVEAGLGVPREPMRLVGDPEALRLLTVDSGRDMTGVMRLWSRDRVEALAAEGLCGFIFKARSPCCGIKAVCVFTEDGLPASAGAGIFARAFMDAFPHVPVEDESALADPKVREDFIGRIFTYSSFRKPSDV